MTPAVQQQLRVSLAARYAPAAAPASVDLERVSAQDRVIADVRRDLRAGKPSRLEGYAQA